MTAEGGSTGDAERLEGLLGRLGIGVRILSADGSHVFANAAHERIIGRQVDPAEMPEAYAQRYGVFRAGTDEPYPLAEMPIMRGMHEPSEADDIEIRRPEGSVVLRVWGAPAVLPDGRHGVVSAIIDNSRQFQIERDRATLERQLYRAQSMELLGQFAGGIAHDFNNGLTVIKAQAELIAASAPEGSQLQADANDIMRAVDRQAALTRQLLDLGRTERYVEVVTLHDLLLREEKLFRRMIGDDITLEHDLRATRDRIAGDPRNIERVMMNLATNARDAMPGGGRLYVTTEDHAFDVTEAAARRIEPGDYIRVDITDTGTGMDSKTLNRVFEPLFTTKPTGKGTGLGLAIVYRTIQEAGGTIDVTSTVGEGTTFTIYLPTLEMDERLSNVTARDGTNPFGKETVLLVEDDPSVRRVIQRGLTEYGYRVIVAAGHAQALDTVRDDITGASIDVLVTDVNMPGMKGPELARAVRATRPHIKVLVVSGSPHTDDRAYSDPVPGTAYLPKPFTHREVGARVRALCDGTDEAL